jgi:methyl-galactoside transport system substrate-binding protein
MAGTIKQDAEGMAEAIKMSIDNGLGGKKLFEGMNGYQIDDSVSKLRIAYDVYLGEKK